MFAALMNNCWIFYFFALRAHVHNPNGSANRVTLGRQQGGGRKKDFLVNLRSSKEPYKRNRTKIPSYTNNLPNARPKGT
jgi:hypothetical protein